MKIHKNIKDNIGIFLIALFFIIVTIGAVSYTKEMLKNSINQNKENIKEVTLQISHNIESKIDNYINELTFIGSKAELNDKKQIQISTDILNNKVQSGKFNKVLVLGLDGKGKNNLGGDVFLKNEKILEKTAKSSKPTILYSSKFTSYENDVILYSVPIENNNELIGIVVGINDMASITEKLTSGIYEGKGCSYIIDKSGDILFSRHRYNQGANLYDFLDERSIDNAKSNYDGDGYWDVKGEIHGKKSYFGFSKIKNTDWYIVTSIPAKNILLQIKDSAKIMISLLIMVILLSLSICSYIIRIQKLNEKKIMKIAFRDSLTGLMNYNKFVSEVEEYLLRQRRKQWVLVCFDIDKFKLVNDIHGYKVGDEILKIISNNLNYYFKGDIVYGRLGGDTFGVLLETKEEFEIDEIAKFIKKNIGNIESTKNFNLEINIDLSIGIYKIEDEAINIKKFIDNADMARLKSKETRYKEYIVFDENMSREKKKILQMERDLFLAIKNKEFSIHYQPKFNINTGKIVGAEALIRWIHPTMGMVSPMEFIPIAEKTRFINNIGQWVFDEVCKKLRCWIDEGIEVVPIAINLSRVELYQQDLVDMLEFGINKYKLDPKLIEIEITESTALNDIEFINEKLSGIKALGMKVAMDDFGTGNSNLSNLKDIQIDVLKLDKSLLLDIENNEKTELMLKSIVDLSKNLSLNTVCEGVENMSQVEILKGTGCEVVQGYVFSKPVEVEKYKKLLLRNIN
ncbi:bifunctional diguanylate cyclase/phosphodiesterase [[Clostridium] dakarense]|uniref:bifunctional diguanylate cyclase/phosphodiesterase n=1 Tax=Faecalimicrobium dakarense TaxID=1301100 RepID=UPI0004B1EC24|nr:EAL domain-containing protein [[Clostridium] dakarense]